MALGLPARRPGETTFPGMRTLLLSVTAGIAVSVLAYALTGASVLLLPLVLVLPLTFSLSGRRR